MTVPPAIAMRGGWYGLLAFDCPVVAYVRVDGPLGDWFGPVAWWSTIVIPRPECTA